MAPDEPDATDMGGSDTAVEIVSALLEIIEGPDAEWLGMDELDKQAVVIARAKAWLQRESGGTDG